MKFDYGDYVVIPSCGQIRDSHPWGRSVSKLWESGKMPKQKNNLPGYIKASKQDPSGIELYLVNTAEGYFVLSDDSIELIKRNQMIGQEIEVNIDDEIYICKIMRIEEK